MRKEALNEENEYNANLSFGTYDLVETSTSLASKQWTFSIEAVDIRCRSSVRSGSNVHCFGSERLCMLSLRTRGWRESKDTKNGDTAHV